LEEKRVMPIKRYKPEQIVTMLRQIEVSIANRCSVLWTRWTQAQRQIFYRTLEAFDAELHTVI
jgi:hypothetical protein